MLAALLPFLVHPIVGEHYYSAILLSSHRATVVFLEESIGFGWEPMTGRGRWAFYEPRSGQWQTN